jgi:hypothetical protein
MKDRNSKPERGGEWELIKILLEGDIGVFGRAPTPKK